MYEPVATSLHSQALAMVDPEQRDVFARSAFNRLYYSTFLVVRSVLKDLNPEWGYIAHKTVPEVLRGQIVSTLAKGISASRKANDVQTLSQCSSAKKAAEELASLLQFAYATRVTADYRPEIKISNPIANDYKLNEVSVSSARNWPIKASGLARSIKNAWIQLHV